MAWDVGCIPLIHLIPCIASKLLRALAVTLLVVVVAEGIIALERRRRRWEREEEERQERDRALNDLFQGEDLLDDPEPEENDDWVASMRDDRPLDAACDEVFGECDNNWTQELVGWCAPQEPGVNAGPIRPSAEKGS